MRTFLTIFLLITTLAVGFRFGGMAFMDHQGEMGGMDCIAHCLQAASDYSAALATNFFQVSLLLTFVATFFISVIQKKDALKFFRNDQGIARLLLRRLLATVVIQD